MLFDYNHEEFLMAQLILSLIGLAAVGVIIAIVMARKKRAARTNLASG